MGLPQSSEGLTLLATAFHGAAFIAHYALQIGIVRPHKSAILPNAARCSIRTHALARSVRVNLCDPP
jgi:hypothetical protein